jgi:hypothetical protein
VDREEVVVDLDVVVLTCWSTEERSRTSSVLKGDESTTGRTGRMFGTRTESSRFSFASRIEWGMPLRRPSTCRPPEKGGM